MRDVLAFRSQFGAIGVVVIAACSLARHSRRLLTVRAVLLRDEAEALSSVRTGS